jgi:hypothetical protein
VIAVVDRCQKFTVNDRPSFDVLLANNDLSRRLVASSFVGLLTFPWSRAILPSEDESSHELDDDELTMGGRCQRRAISYRRGRLWEFRPDPAVVRFPLVRGSAFTDVCEPELCGIHF